MNSNRASCKLTESDIALIRQLYDNGTPHKSIADEFKISVGTVGRIGRRIHWKFVDGTEQEVEEMSSTNQIMDKCKEIKMREQFRSQVKLFLQALEKGQYIGLATANVKLTVAQNCIDVFSLKQHLGSQIEKTGADLERLKKELAVLVQEMEFLESPESASSDGEIDMSTPEDDMDDDYDG